MHGRVHAGHHEAAGHRQTREHDETRGQRTGDGNRRVAEHRPDHQRSPPESIRSATQQHGTGAVYESCAGRDVAPLGQRLIEFLEHIDEDRTGLQPFVLLHRPTEHDQAEQPPTQAPGRSEIDLLVLQVRPETGRRFRRGYEHENSSIQCVGHRCAPDDSARRISLCASEICDRRVRVEPGKEGMGCNE